MSPPPDTTTSSAEVTSLGVMIGSSSSPPLPFDPASTTSPSLCLLLRRGISHHFQWRRTASPQLEGGGRLPDQHLQAVDGHRPTLSCACEQVGAGGSVDNVENDLPRRYVIGQRRRDFTCLAHTERGGVDEQALGGDEVAGQRRQGATAQAAPGTAAATSAASRSAAAGDRLTIVSRIAQARRAPAPPPGRRRRRRAAGPCAPRSASPQASMQRAAHALHVGVVAAQSGAVERRSCSRRRSARRRLRASPGRGRRRPCAAR